MLIVLCIILVFYLVQHKEITTKYNTSLESIKVGLDLLNPGGIMTICIYSGHDEGKREENLHFRLFKTNIEKAIWCYDS